MRLGVGFYIYYKKYDGVDSDLYTFTLNLYILPFIDFWKDFVKEIPKSNG